LRAGGRTGGISLAVLRRALRIIHYAILLFRIAGPKVFFHQLRRQVYSRDTLLGLERNLDRDVVKVSSLIQYSLGQASKKDMEEMLSKARTESKESPHELIERR
jgi:hypothetical protein